MASKPTRPTFRKSDVIDVDEIEQEDDVDEITPVLPRCPPQTTNPTHQLEHDELTQPFVDIHALFRQFNLKHFSNNLTCVYVEYSTRMTLCAGTCTFKGAGGIRVALSEPLLKYRPRSDLLSTLLHEMIHAHLFLTDGVAARDGPDGHGPKFLAHAARINQAEGGRVNITPYHTFQDEVDLYRVHHWQCDRCQMLIKRAMNRAPAPRDPFWPGHERKCGGKFVKTREPEKKKKIVKRAPKTRAVAVDPKNGAKVELPKGVMKTHRIDSMLAGQSSKRPRVAMVACPVCNNQVVHATLNEHLDTCLNPSIFSQSVGEDVVVPPSDEEEVSRPQSKGSESKGGADGRGRLGQVKTAPPASLRKAPEPKGSAKNDVGRGGRSSPRPPIQISLLDGNDDKTLADLPTVDLTDDSKTSFGSLELQSHVTTKRQRSWRSDAKREQNEYQALKKIIRDPDHLMALALDPLKVTAESIKSVFEPRERGSAISAENGAKCDLAAILEPVLHKNTAYEMEQVAKARLQPLCLDQSGRDFTFYEAAQRAQMDQENFVRMALSRARKDKDNSYILSEDILDNTISANEKGCHSSKERDKSNANQISNPTRDSQSPVIDLNAADTHSRSNLQYPVSRIERTKPKAERAVGEGKGKGKGKEATKKQHDRNIGNCPVCDISIPRSELECHVNICLNSTEAVPMFGEVDDIIHVDTPKPSIPRDQGALSNRNKLQELPQCPVCDVRMPRQTLESHVAICMMSAGLGDAF